MTNPALLFDAAFHARASRLSCRPETPADRGFLIDQFVACSALAGVLPPAMVEQQACFQIDSHNHAYPQAMRRIACAEGRPIGRMMIDWTADNGHGVDLAVLADDRTTGAGLHFLRAWTATCDATGRTASLEVLADNPAAYIYRRLGFVAAAGTTTIDPVIEMLRQPRALTAAPAAADQQEGA